MKIQEITNTWAKDKLARYYQNQPLNDIEKQEFAQQKKSFNPDLRSRLSGPAKFYSPKKEFPAADKLDLTAKSPSRKSSTKAYQYSGPNPEKFNRLTEVFNASGAKQGYDTSIYAADAKKGEWRGETRTKSNNLIVRLHSRAAFKPYLSAFDYINIQIPKDDPEIAQAVIDVLPDYPFKYTQRSKKEISASTRATGMTPIAIPDDFSEKVFDFFWDIVHRIDDLGPEYAKGSQQAKRNKAPRKYYVHLAKSLISAWQEEQPWAYSRGGEGSGFDQYDSLITMGYTEAGYRLRNTTPVTASVTKQKPQTWREHVVPGTLISQMGSAVCEKYLGKYRRRSDQTPPDVMQQVVLEVSDIIQRNLAIVICSAAEATYIDTVMGWKTKMPEGWQDGDDILARFTQCTDYPNKGDVGIPVYQINSGKRIAETKK